MSTEDNHNNNNHNKEVTLWKECTTLQIQMKKLLKSNNNPFRKEIEELRSQLRGNYLYLLEHHREFSFNDKDILVNLWKFVFYKQIEFCRKQLRRNKQKQQQQQQQQPDTERRELITKLTEKIIPDAQSLYNKLLTKYLKKAFISKQDGVYVDETLCMENIHENQYNLNEIKLSVQIAHKSLIYIGDLERYKETYLLNNNYDAAKSSYCLAVQLMPTRGNPHNQLAVLNQMQINCDLSAIYQYVLSLFVIEPFMTAKENLSLLFKKTINSVDKAVINNDLIKLISSKSTWKELQIYVIYILALIYQENYRSNPKYHKILQKIQPLILEKINKILLNDKYCHDEQKQKEIGEQDNDQIIKQLCIISIFLVIETFKEKTNYIGYKQAISWTLSFIATMMKSTASSIHNLSLLKPISLCCLWLQNNFDFAIPNIDKSPWIEMQIDQNDLKPNNDFFTQFAKLLNLLHAKYENNKYTQSFDSVITPEQIEFYGVKPLRFIDFYHDKYKYNDNYIFIYHRRFCLKNNQFLQTYLQNDKVNEKIHAFSINKNNDHKNDRKLFNYLRYKKLIQFAQFSSQKVEGVLVFNNNKWAANNLQLTDDTPQQQQPSQQPMHSGLIELNKQQSHSAQNPSTAPYSPPNEPPSQSPPLPLKQKSQPDPFYSPIFRPSNRYSHSNNTTNNTHQSSKTPVHVPQQPHSSIHLNPAHSGHHYPSHHASPSHPALPPAHHHQGGSHHSHHPHHHHSHINYSRSAPSSPRGPPSHHHSSQHRQYMFGQPPLMEEYPEDSEITIPPPFNISISSAFPEHMIKSTPTTPVASQQPPSTHSHHSNQNHINNNGHSSRYPPSRYLHPSLTHSDHEYEQQHPHHTNNNNNHTHNNNPQLTPLSHSYHHTKASHSAYSLLPRNGNGTNGHNTNNNNNHNNGTHNNHKPLAVSSGPTPTDTIFNFSSAYAAAASNTGYSGGAGGGGVNHQPVTQPTTPVFGSHHSASSYSYHGPSSSNHNHHSLYQHHSHHHPIGSSSKYQKSTLPSHQPQNSGPLHTPNNNALVNNYNDEISSPLFYEDLVSEVFDELQLSQH